MTKKMAPHTFYFFHKQLKKQNVRRKEQKMDKIDFLFKSNCIESF